MTPTIRTSRLSLQHLRKATPRQVRWLRNPDVVRFSEQRHRDHSLSTQLSYVDSFAGTSHLWGIYLIEGGEMIGTISARHDAANNVSDVGILIGEPGCWGKGLGREAWIAACIWLLDQNCGSVRKLEAGCMQTNEAMLKILRGSGFTEEGERRNKFLVDDHPVSAVLFGRMR